ncbi:septation ring formation regulator EzrA [Cytobacillus spongiae]|uniref:septation ring formation regulator EzrA n=1 Tax=Cytobacillus spongiae TaxID=2901381 RepID=UPI001F357BB1|nr:septation ring formation regulator EzrA [Cytobacillus spongiae]UII55191.1 septation ring formation regulator EzrA [Cytobacillus spongiae]
MEYIIAGIALLIVLFLTGYVLKKKHYKEIDRLEAWKIDITNRPVLDEMSKVKQLNMTGQTEELFERWRNEWDEIVTVQLPDLEELLFDAEECIDKYRFSKAKQVQLALEKQLTETEEKIKNIILELNELVGSEEKNRTEIEELKEAYRELKKTLLAHRHSFGKAEARIEAELEQVATKFQAFEDHTANGNYLEAREIVFSIQELLGKIEDKMDTIPEFLVECQSKIPNQINELKDGYREMLDQGYLLDHIQLEKEIEQLEKELSTYLDYVEKAILDDVSKGLEDIKESVELLYDLLEKEVHAKHYVNKHEEQAISNLHLTKVENEKLKHEIYDVQQGYHLPDSELEGQKQLDKKITQLSKRFELLQHKVVNEGSAHTLLSEELQEIEGEIQTIQNEQMNLSEKLQALRKDELTARESIQDLSKQITETIRLVSKSNIPGLPKDYKYLMDDARESIQNVKARLDEKPIDIPSVQKYLEIAEMTVEKVVTLTTEMIENVVLAEKLIQYGNRYRSKYTSIDEGLREAEQAFRSYDYHTALEQAASAIEQVEPGALKKIESML